MVCFGKWARRGAGRAAVRRIACTSYRPRTAALTASAGRCATAGSRGSRCSWGRASCGGREVDAEGVGGALERAGEAPSIAADVVGEVFTGEIGAVMDE